MLKQMQQSVSRVCIHVIITQLLYLTSGHKYIHISILQICLTNIQTKLICTENYYIEVMITHCDMTLKLLLSQKPIQKAKSSLLIQVYTPTEHTDMYNTHNIHACRNIHAYTQHIHIHNIYTYYWLVEYYYQSNILLDSRVLLYLYQSSNTLQNRVSLLEYYSTSTRVVIFYTI